MGSLIYFPQGVRKKQQKKQINNNSFKESNNFYEKMCFKSGFFFTLEIMLKISSN